MATQPGRSGEKADKLFGVFSMTIKYLVCNNLVLESGLPQDTIENAGSNVIFRMPGDGHSFWFCGVFVMPMATLLTNHDPTVSLNYTQNFTNSRVLAFPLDNRVAGAILANSNSESNNNSIRQICGGKC